MITVRRTVQILWMLILPLITIPALASTTPVTQHFIVVNEVNNLFKFDDATSGINGVVAVTGLRSGETLLGIDFRTSTGTLYGLGSTSRLYRINYVTGVATEVSSTQLKPL